MSSTLIYSQIFWVNIALCSFLLFIIIHYLLTSKAINRTKKQINLPLAAPLNCVPQAGKLNIAHNLK